MARQVEELAGTDVPQPSCCGTGRHDPAAVGAEGRVRDEREVPAKHPQKLTSFHIPNSTIVIPARRYDQGAVPAEACRRELGPMASQRRDALPGGGAPETRGRVVPGGQDEPAVGLNSASTTAPR